MGGANEVHQAHEEKQQDEGHEGENQGEPIAQLGRVLFLRLALAHRSYLNPRSKHGLPRTQTQRRVGTLPTRRRGRTLNISAYPRNLLVRL